jgi:hypothetical protein
MQFPIIDFSWLFKPKPEPPPEPKAEPKIEVKRVAKGYLHVGYVMETK